MKKKKGVLRKKNALAKRAPRAKRAAARRAAPRLGEARSAEAALWLASATGITGLPTTPVIPQRPLYQGTYSQVSHENKHYNKPTAVIGLQPKNREKKKRRFE